MTAYYIYIHAYDIYIQLVTAGWDRQTALILARWYV